jgi:hypothetical protein
MFSGFFFANMEDDKEIQFPMVPAALVVLINITVKLPAVWLTNIAACFTLWRAFLSYGTSFHSRPATSACWRPCSRPELLESTLLLPEQFDRLKVRPSAHRRPEGERLLSAPAMGQQKPSELLAETMRICSGGEETSVFFHCLFLQKMPMSLRILLSEAGMADSQLFRRRADQIWAHQPSLHHVSVAAVF